MNAPLAVFQAKGTPAAQIMAIDALERDASEIVTAFAEVSEIGARNIERSGDANNALLKLASLEIDKAKIGLLREQIEAGLQPADDKTTRTQLAFLAGSFPGSGASDPKVYAAAMLAEVSAAAPTVLVLYCACSRLRRTLKWPPSIAQVLDAIAHEKWCWSDRAEAASSFPELRAGLVEKIRTRRAELIASEKAKREELKKQIADLTVKMDAIYADYSRVQKPACTLYRIKMEIAQLQGELEGFGG